MTNEEWKIQIAGRVKIDRDNRKVHLECFGNFVDWYLCFDHFESCRSIEEFRRRLSGIDDKRIEAYWIVRDQLIEEGLIHP